MSSTGRIGDQELVERFVDAVEHLNRQIHSDRLDEWTSLAMTIPQVKTLVLLDTIGPMRMGALSGHLGSALSATTNVVERLVERKLVERGSDPADRRVVICELSSRGRETVGQFWRVGRERLLPLAELLGQDRLAIAVQGLEAIREAEDEVQRGSGAAQSGD